ncbi:cyclic-phosphate processing receiver domain-containing protein [Actinoplanes sp. NPDC049596]|uniref:cyclic-phosphate processing receiver domain-containing protein n=1 Tax=unclassified Actinoplanes TaxID=2626549 RepID=UPI0034404892
MNAVVVLIDDLRSFADGRPAELARTSAAGVTLLDELRGRRIDELWLDHDLGGEDTIWPVVELLERAAFDGRPFDIGIVYIHSANPPGVVKIRQALERWNYPVRSVPGSPHVAY